MAFPKPLRIEPARSEQGNHRQLCTALSQDTQVQLWIAKDYDLVAVELGFDAGFAYDALQDSLTAKDYRGRCFYVGCEERPLQRARVEDLKQANQGWRPSTAPRAGFVQDGDTLLLLHGNPVDTLHRLSAKVDLWLLGADVWQQFSTEEQTDLRACMAKLSRAGAVIISSEAAQASEIKNSAAIFSEPWSPRSKPKRPWSIAGTGVAGLNLAFAAKEAGQDVVLHGSGLSPQGSAVPYALVNYKPSHDQSPLGHLRKAAFFHLGLYKDFAKQGVETRVTDQKSIARWRAEREVDFEWIGEDRVRVLSALMVDTKAFRASVLNSVSHHEEPVETLDGLWALAAGLGSKDFEAFGLNANRGQQDAFSLNPPLLDPLNFGRLVLPVPNDPDGVAWVGASFDRSPPPDWQSPSLADRRENLERFTAAFPSVQARDLNRSWVGLRATTRDHLPLAGTLAQGTHVLTGLGSKGFLYAPLLAKCIVHQSLGLPLPLEAWVWQALNPYRFTTAP